MSKHIKDINILQVCREYQRGACSRDESECRYGHPPTHVSIDNSDGMVTVCMDFMKGKCQREMCRYFHPPVHLQGKVRAAQQSASGGQVYRVECVFSLLKSHNY